MNKILLKIKLNRLIELALDCVNYPGSSDYSWKTKIAIGLGNLIMEYEMIHLYGLGLSANRQTNWSQPASEIENFLIRYDKSQ